MKHLTRKLLILALAISLVACFENDRDEVYYSGIEVNYGLATYSHSADIPNQMMVVTNSTQLTAMWNYFTELLVDAGEVNIPVEPTIDFGTQSMVALFITDRSACEHTLLNGIIDDDELLSVRLKRLINTSTSCVQVLDPRLYVITINRNIAYPGKLYELYYDCLYCEV